MRQVSQRYFAYWQSDIKAAGFCDIIFATKLGEAEYHTA